MWEHIVKLNTIGIFLSLYHDGYVVSADFSAGWACLEY